MPQSQRWQSRGVLILLNTVVAIAVVLSAMRDIAKLMAHENP